MKFAGLNVVTVLAAAAAIYAIGFLIYGALFSAQWMALAGYTPESFKGLEWRMALSPVMPVLIAIGVGLAVKWRGAKGLGPGVATGAIAALTFLVAGRLYGFTYGTEKVGLLALDSAHLLLNGVAAGAVFGAWKSA
jgi:hypothetical protein